MSYVTLTRRTDDPKLRHIEGQLTRLGIPHRRVGYSFHAPILQVPADRLAKAEAILEASMWVDGKWVPYDDIPDDHPMFWGEP